MRVNNYNIYNKEAILKEIGNVLDSGILTNNGNFVHRLERSYMDWLGTSNCHAVSNGTTGLQMALRVLDIKGEVITTPFSFVASASSILWEHCKPVFADIDKQTLCLDPGTIEALITPETTAILAVHVFGNPCSVFQIDEIAKRHGLKVIYDGAHALGSKLNRKSICVYGDISVVSLHAFKIATSAEGGLVFCKSDSTSGKIFETRYFGNNAENHPMRVGLNGKMSELHAALGLVSLRYAKKEIAARQRIAEWYRIKLKPLRDSLSFQHIQEDAECNCSYFPVILKDSSKMEKLIKLAASKEIILRRYFYPGLNHLPYLEEKAACPVSDDISSRVLCLPINSCYSFTDLQRLVDVFNTVLQYD